MYLNFFVASPDAFSIFFTATLTLGMLSHMGYINFALQVPVRCGLWEIPVGTRVKNNSKIEILIPIDPF